MPQDTFHELLRDLIAFNPEAQIKKTITVDPLVMDGLELEQSLLKGAHFMENTEWAQNKKQQNLCKT